MPIWRETAGRHLCLEGGSDQPALQIATTEKGYQTRETPRRTLDVKTIPRR